MWRFTQLFIPSQPFEWKDGPFWAWLKTALVLLVLSPLALWPYHITLSHIISYYIMSNHLYNIWHHRCCFPELESAFPSLCLDVSYLDVWALKTPRMATDPTRFARSASWPLGTRCSGHGQGHPEQNGKGWQGMIYHVQLENGLFYGLLYCSSLLYAIYVRSLEDLEGQTTGWWGLT